MTFISTAPTTRSSGEERDALNSALGRGVSSQALEALLRSESPNAASLAACIVWISGAAFRVERAGALCARGVLDALLDAALAVEPAAAREATLLHELRHPAVDCPAVYLLTGVLFALSMTLKDFPRTAVRLEKAPQRDALLHLIGRFSPLRPRLLAPSLAPALHHGGVHALLSSSGCIH